MDKLNCNAILMKTAANPMESSEDTTVLHNCFELESGG